MDRSSIRRTAAIVMAQRGSATARLPRSCLRLACMIGLALAGAGCGLFGTTTPPAAPPGLLLPGQTAGVFTTARPTMGAVINDFLSRPPTPVQPIEFPYNVHVAKKIACTEYCHESVTTGPVADLPSVRTCMI